MRKLWIAWLVATFAMAVVYVSYWKYDKSGVFFTFLSFLPVAAIAVGTRWAAPSLRKAWVLFGIGQFFFFLGDLIAYNYEWIFNKALPFPAISDVFYILTYPFMILGLIVVTQRIPFVRERIFSTLTLFLGIGVGATALAFAPSILEGKSLVSAYLGFIYPFLDIVVLVTLGASWRRWSPAAFYVLIFGVLALLAVDVTYAYAEVIHANFDARAGLLDLGWALYYSCLGAVALTRNGDRPFVAEPL